MPRIDRYVALYILLGLIVAGSLFTYYMFFHPSVVLRVSTTTSLYATGLLDKLADEFMERHPGVMVQFIPVGSGEALRRASLGDADLVLVHAPNLEKIYLSEGYIMDGRIFAYNYFVIVGPPDDPAGIRGMGNATEAFIKIYESGLAGESLFVSRGDNSGTHNRELFIWSKAGLEPGGSWYIESGSGMSQTLEIANEKSAYTLSDMGTFLKLKKTGVIDNLEIMVSGDPDLINIYSVYLVNPSKVDDVNIELAKEFMNFIVGEDGQRIISEYGVSEYGSNLFYPVNEEKLPELKEIWNYFAS